MSIKNLYISLIFSKLVVTKLLITINSMYNLYAIFVRFLDISKQLADNLVNESGNVPRCGVVPIFSDLEIIALSLTSEAIGIDSESFLFSKLQEYRTEFLIWSLVDNIMTDVNTRLHSVRSFVREWFNIWMDVKNTFA